MGIERERESPVRQNVSATVWGAWWCGTHQQSFRLFNFSATVVQVSPRCVVMKMSPFYLLK